MDNVKWLVFVIIIHSSIEISFYVEIEWIIDECVKKSCTLIFRDILPNIYVLTLIDSIFINIEFNNDIRTNGSRIRDRN